MIQRAALIVLASLLVFHTSAVWAEDKVDLPAFKPATVTLKDEKVSIEFRRFGLDSPMGEIDPATLPDSDTATVITAWQALSRGDRDAFLDASFDRKQAERFAQAIEKKSEAGRKAWFDEVFGREVAGEIKVEDATLVVAVSGEGEKANRAVYFTTRDEGQALMIAVPYYLMDEVNGLKQAAAIAQQLRTGELSLEEIDG